MTKEIKVGKREFIQHTSHYLKHAEQEGSVIITHQGKPALKLIRLQDRTIADLRGLVKYVRVIGDINEPVFPGYDEW